MQFIEIPAQLLSLLQAVLFGGAACVAYDGVFLVRCLLVPPKKEGRILTALLDVLYFFLLGCAFSVFLYAVNFGRFRWYLALFSFMGFVLCRCTLSKGVRHVISLVTGLLRKILSSVFALFKKIILSVLRAVLCPLGKVKNAVKKSAEEIRQKRKQRKNEKIKKLRQRSAASGRRKEGADRGQERNKLSF